MCACSSANRISLEIVTRLVESGARLPPVLFVHGAFHGAWCWEEHFIPYFATSGLDTYALSLRGHGKSDGHEQIDLWGLKDYCDDIDQVCQALPMPPILVGQSLGAVVLQQYVQAHQSSGVVMLAPTPLAPMALAKLRWALRFPVATIRALVTGDVNYALPTFRHNFFSPQMNEAQVNQYMARMQRESKRVFREVSQIRDPNPRGVHVPTLILAAQQDRIPRRINQRLAASFHADLYTLPVAHDIMLDPKWQMAADQIINWIMRLDYLEQPAHRPAQSAAEEGA